MKSWLKLVPLLFVLYLTSRASGWNDIMVDINGKRSSKTISLPSSNWTLVADGNRIDETGISNISNRQISILPATVYILFKP